MALFGKESLSGALGKAKELAGKATKAAKTGIATENQHQV